MTKDPYWLDLAKRLNSIARVGLEFGNDEYDLERYEQIKDISEEIMSNYSNLEKKRVQCLFENEKGYPTPKVDVRAVVFQQDKVLLVKEKAEGLWALPGGWAESFLSVRENVVKETLEESGMRVEAKRIIAIYDRKRHNSPPKPFGVYKIFVQCDFLEGKFEPNIETEDADFFPEDHLPPLAENKCSLEQIKRCFSARLNSSYLPYFD